MNKEKNKALIIGLVNTFFIFVFEITFIYIWLRDLNILKINPFENKGNWLLASVYLVELTLLLKAYGGLKIGHLERWNVTLSQFLSLFICNVIMSVQVILMIGDLHQISEILEAFLMLMLADICLIILMVYIFDGKLRKIYPAKNLLLIHGDYPPESI